MCENLDMENISLLIDVQNALEKIEKLEEASGYKIGKLINFFIKDQVKINKG